MHCSRSLLFSYLLPARSLVNKSARTPLLTNLRAPSTCTNTWLPPPVGRLVGLFVLPGCSTDHVAHLAIATVLPPSLATAPSQAPPSALAQDPLLHPQGATFTPAPDVVSYDPSTTPQNPAHHVAPAPAGSKTSSLQVNVDKVKVQLEAKGGKHGAWLAGQIQGQADALKKIPVVGGEFQGLPGAF